MSLNDATGLVIFQAEYDFTPSHDGEIALEVGDQCYVQKPISDAKGWLQGFNSRSEENGQFPGTYCLILNNNAVLPPLPPKPNPRAAPRKVMVDNHQLVKFNVTKPIYCQHCNGYIWGGKLICLLCTNCHLASHLGCHRTFKKERCQRNTSQSVLKELRKPVKDWSTSEVLEWMLAVHFHPYVQMFRKNNIDGTLLHAMTASQLKQIGISFDFHAHNLVLCIEELISPPPVEKQLSTSIDFVESTEIETHSLIEHTFTTHQMCDVCQKPMFGIIRQGLMCYRCGIQFHRPCAVLCRQSCPETYNRGRRPSDSQDPSFCCNFDTKNIPPVMRKCINAVANRGYDTKNIYRDFCGYDECRSLRSALNQNVMGVDMNDSYWSDPLCAAYVLKTFLLELPVPLISFEWYESFISLAKFNDYTSDEVHDLLKMLPESNYAHLEFLLRHLVSVSKHSDDNDMTIENLAEEFSLFILRPPDSDIWSFARNLVFHERVVYILLSVIKGQESPQNEEDFKNEKWLWPEATRKDVSQRLSGAPDGSFSIRQSEGRKGEWTLTVRKEGRERLIRIIQRDGRYGFREELLNFGSLNELVQYFREHSLEDYNPKLNIKLLYPCGRPDKIKVPAEDQQHLWDRYEVVVNKLNHVKFMEMKLEEKQLTLEECRGLSESQIDVVNFLEEQIDRAQKHFNEAHVRDREDLQSSIVMLNKLLNDEKEKWARLDEELTSLKQECDQLTTQLTELSPEVPMLQEEYNQLDPKIRKSHPDNFDNEEKEEENLEELEKIYDSIPPGYHPSGTDLQEEYWLFNKLDRATVKKMLDNKPDGTFLVRDSDRYPYVISMMYDSSIKHIPILKGPNGYGFAQPHNIYPTLHELINHYHHQSLRMHNKHLDTTLQFPYRFLEQTEDEPIYD